MNMLTPEEKIIHISALAFHDLFLRETGATGMCFRASIFLAQYLIENHTITVEPIVGYAYDGESDFLHVWIEFNGKMTDISLTQTENDILETGAMIINDQVVRPGQVSYEYRRGRHPDSETWLRDLRKDPIGSKVLKDVERQHVMMTRIASDPRLWRPYLDDAPDGYDYARLRSIIHWATL